MFENENPRLSRILDFAAETGFIDPAETDSIISQIGNQGTERELESVLIEKALITREQWQALKKVFGSQNQNPSNDDRFQIINPHAEGGLGKVFLAEDQELNRQVALKQLKPRFSQDEELRHRFIKEAELTGGLEHPGIVPVYGLGIGQDGVPYYAMRFIRGNSLKQAIDLYHRETKLKETPAQRNIVFRKLVTQFVNICQTLNFAHSRGVLHRDIKPDNIMLGEFGETMIVDWGIAKVVGRRDTDTRDKHDSVDSSDSPIGSTRQGSVVGTVGYMSPEQALGWHDSLTPRSDVFSLGATLFYLLTGKNPFDSQAGMDQIIEQTCSDQLPGPRDLDRTISRPLAAICKKAMSNKASARYESADAMANDLEAWLADEKVMAWNEPLLVGVNRFVRRHRTAVTISMASLALLALLAITATILVNQQRQIAETARQRAIALAGQKQKLADEKQQLAEKERTARLFAVGQQEKAENAQQESDQVLRFMISVFRSPDPELDGRAITIAETLDDAVLNFRQTIDEKSIVSANILTAIAETYEGLGLRKDALETAQLAYKMISDDRGGEHVDAMDVLSMIGQLKHHLGNVNAAVQVLEKVHQVRQQAFGDDEYATRLSLHHLVSAYQAQGKTDEAIQMAEKLLQRTIELDGENSDLAILVLTDLLDAHQEKGEFQKALEIGAHVSKIVESVDGKNSDRALGIQDSIADVYMALGKGNEVLKIRQAILNRRLEKLGEAHPHSIVAKVKLASLFGDAKLFDRALKQIDEVIITIRNKYGEEHFYYVVAQNRRGRFLAGLNRVGDALDVHEANYERAKRVLGQDHQHTLVAVDNLAVTYSLSGQLKKALPMVKELYTMRNKKLGANDRRTLLSLNNFAFMTMMVGDSNEARNLFEKLISGWEQVDTDLGHFYNKTALEGFVHCLSRLRDDHAVIENCDKFIKLLTNNDQQDKIRRARINVLKAEALAGIGSVDSANNLINQVLDDFENLPIPNGMKADAGMVLAYVLIKQKEWESAKELIDEQFPVLQRSIKAWPFETRYRLVRGLEIQRELYVGINNDDKVREMNKAIEKAKSEIRPAK